MQIAITAAKFTPDQADGLRRAMATFRHTGKIHLYRDAFIANMTDRGYDRTFAESCFGQIEGFGEYGFPESHAASFALLVYASAWMKCHYPDVFCAAILNSQPMGFYQPAQLVRDARNHGVEVREVDVNLSQWDCTLEPATSGSHRFAVRLGIRQIDGLSEEELKRLFDRRGNGYASPERLAAISGLSKGAIEHLAAADAFRSMGLDRRAALWAVRRLGTIGISGPGRKAESDAAPTLPLFQPRMSDELFPEPEMALEPMALSEHVAEDYVTTGLSLKAHPVSFFRERLTRLRIESNAVLQDEGRAPHDTRVTIAGLVLTRQMPGGKKVVFVTLEDETGIANIIVWPKVFEKNRRTVMRARFLAVEGRIQRAGLVVHVLAERFLDLSADLNLLSHPDRLQSESAHPPAASDPLGLKSRDFH